MSTATPALQTRAPRELRFTRVFNAPRSLVYQVWTEPLHVAAWWGPHGFTNPVCTLDAQTGGLIRIEMRVPDGAIYPMTGEFKELVEPGRIVFLSTALDADGEPLFNVLSTVTLTEKNGKTTLVLDAKVLDEHAGAEGCIQGMGAGWTQSLERVECYLQGASTNADPSSRELVNTRILAAPRELVFDAWTKPEHINQWWGPRGFTTTSHEMEVRPGGLWRFIMHGPDGTDYGNRIEYLEVVKPERLVYHHGEDVDNDPGNFHVTVTFEDADEGRTRLTMRMVTSSLEQRNAFIEFGAVKGGHETLERLAQHLAGM